MGEGRARASIPAVDSAAKVVAEVAALPECRGPLRRQYGDLARRVKLLSPLFEELRDGVGGAAAETGLAALEAALISARELLQAVSEGSRVYQAGHIQEFSTRFIDVTKEFENALGKISYNELDISEEVREQIELIHAQFKRAKERVDPPDVQLCEDIKSIISEKTPDPAILKRVSEKLELRTINDLKKEDFSFNDVFQSIGREAGDEEYMSLSDLLKKIKDCVIMENPNSDASENKISLSKLRCPVIPDDFRCPISLELMKDPVIVSTGQTYERSSIQKWLNSGHKVCPKTQQTLSHMTLTPNFVLKSLIAQWCESNGIELPKSQGANQDNKSANIKSDCDRAGIRLLLKKLVHGDEEDQRAATGQLRLLAKRNADNRICIAEERAIPLLIDLLSSSDQRTQEHAVTALLNLSINENNKMIIVSCRNAIPKIVEVLKTGSMEARENAAAALFSLSVIDSNKEAIGAAGAIPALIDLLCEGSPRGKKDAATAIYNLCINPLNKLRAVKAGMVDYLLKLLVDPSSGMVDEALAILAILTAHQDGRAAVVHSKPIPLLVGLIRTGSPRNRENAAAVLWCLCTADAALLIDAKKCGAEETLKELSECGTDRAKRKAVSMLELLRQNAAP